MRNPATKCATTMRVWGKHRRIERCVMRLQKQVKDLKINNKELGIIFNYHTVWTCVVIHYVLNKVMYEVKI